MLNIGSAVPPQQVSDTDYELEIAYPTTHQLNDDYYIHTHVIDVITQELVTSGISCYYHFYNHQLEGDQHISTGEMTPYGVGYNATVDGSLINESGEYSTLAWCNSTGKIGVNKYTFKVNEAGVEITEGRSMLVIGLLGLLVFFLFLSLYSLFSIEDYKGRFALYWVSHVLMILITFVAWQVGVEGLLSGFALTGVFRIMFWVFTVGAFPMLLLSIAWIVYIHTVNDHTKKLMEKGEDPETAFSMAKKKAKRRKY